MDHPLASYEYSPAVLVEVYGGCSASWGCRRSSLTTTRRVHRHNANDLTTGLRFATNADVHPTRAIDRRVVFSFEVNDVPSFYFSRLATSTLPASLAFDPGTCDDRFGSVGIVNRSRPVPPTDCLSRQPKPFGDAPLRFHGFVCKS